MADVYKTTDNLIIEFGFIDGDTRTISLRSPKNNLAESDIESLDTFIRENNILIGDREGSDFRSIKKAVKRTTTTIYLDLSD